MTNSSKRILFYAPNVHVGGGFILLKLLLKELEKEENIIFWLDARAKSYLELNSNMKVFWVENTLIARFTSEWHLHRYSQNFDKLFCFHGLPPLFPNKAEINIFLQNRNYLGAVPLNSFAFKTRLRLSVEQFISRTLKKRVDTYWVQTPSMREALNVWAEGYALDVRVMPFCDSLGCFSRTNIPKWDFVYVADGEAHKNHKVLIQAWKLLFDAGLKPSLALTLSARDSQLKAWIREQTVKFDLNVHDLGQMPHSDVLTLYASSGALIFPSKSESFGLPLIEAANAGLPILAGELDFIRDVCCPVQTFDPTSAISIYRAVRRFMSNEESPLVPVTATDFLEALLDK